LARGGRRGRAGPLAAGPPAAYGRNRLGSRGTMSEPRNTFVPHPGVREGCGDCKGESYVIARDGERAVARLCGCVGTCPLCAGTERAAVRVRCRCEVVQSRIRRFDDARLPARHANSTRAGFTPSKATMAAFLGVSRYLAEYRPGGENRGLVLYGEVGRGKTHL